MKNRFFKLLLPMLLLFFVTAGASAAIDVHIKKAGTLATMLTATESTIKITGDINGTDIKHLRELINAGKVTGLDLAAAHIVAGGEAYIDSLVTESGIIGQRMFDGCTNLRTIELPADIKIIADNAFARSGLTKVEIPNSVTRVGEDAFAYCENLSTVVIGSKVTKLAKGAFYKSPVKSVRIKCQTPPSASGYIFSSRPQIEVYSDIVEEYKECGWMRFGKIIGGLEATCPKAEDPNKGIKILCEKFFEDAACTRLKGEYQAMSDEKLTAKMSKEGMPEAIIAIAIKSKNNSWSAYEKEFRIQSYKAYSDAAYWNRKLRSTGGSYMGNPIGIYCSNDEPLYVFVDSDVPEDAILYFEGCLGNDVISRAKSGRRLSKGLNIIDGEKDALYYVIYTADTRSQTKRVSEWPEIKIHIEGGVVNGYYDLAKKSDKEYTRLLNAATHKFFTVKGSHSLFNFKTASYKKVWPTSIDRSICWFDSITVWQQELMGYCESVATGKRNHAPYNLNGGEAIAPAYYNNPNFAIEGNAADAGYANSTPYRTSYNSDECIYNSFHVDHFEMDEWCVGHECGHNNQGTINLEGGTEVSNNIFSNLGRFLFGRSISKGSALSFIMTEHAARTPYYVRTVDSQLRMYYQLYLYYHQAQKNTSFYPELFKALREDPLEIWGDSYNSSLKFVRKVCEVAQEDLTEFFTAWGFFEPFENMFIEDYGPHRMTVTQADIDRTLAEISKYPKKNRTILFIEDRTKPTLTNDSFWKAGEKRIGTEEIGQFGDLGQFTDYLPGACEPSSYTYTQSDSLYRMEGKGGVGFLVLDKNEKFVYASNAKNFCVPTCVGTELAIYSIDADGTMHKAEKKGNGTIRAKRVKPGKLAKKLPEHAIKAIISGSIDGTDIAYIRRLSNEGSLASIDLSKVTVKAGGEAYYKEYISNADEIGKFAFNNCHNLINIKLPESITKIGGDAFSRSVVKEIVIPESVTVVGGDAFAYCQYLKKVTIGSNVKYLEKGAFYESPVKDVYVKALTPPKVSSYLFSKKPIIHVHPQALAAYEASEWAQYGTIVGDLDSELK